MGESWELRGYPVSTDQEHLLHHAPVSCEASACGKRRGDNSVLGTQHIHLFLLVDEEKEDWIQIPQTVKQRKFFQYPKAYKCMPDYVRTIIHIPECVIQRFF